MSKELVKNFFEAIKRDDVKSMQKALAEGNIDVIKVENEENDYSPLHWAAFYGCKECIEELLARGVNVNMVGEYDKTPLHEAATQGRADCVALLLSVPGIEVNAKTKDGRTPLHWAADYGNFDCVEILLADPRVTMNAKDRDHKTPLDLAKKGEYSNIVKLFDEKKQDSRGGKPKTKSSKETTIYSDKKYVVRIGSRGGRYILVGTEKKKVYV